MAHVFMSGGRSSPFLLGTVEFQMQLGPLLEGPALALLCDLGQVMRPLWPHVMPCTLRVSSKDRGVLLSCVFCISYRTPDCVIQVVIAWVTHLKDINICDDKNVATCSAYHPVLCTARQQQGPTL